MSKLNRRRFLTLASIGSTAIVAASVSGNDLLRSTEEPSGVVTFRAVTGMPQNPLPSYASYVIEGHIDLASQTGVVTQGVFAGDPTAMSSIALPGLSRVARVIAAKSRNNILEITAVVDDRSQLHSGEEATIKLRIDRANNTVVARFYGGDHVELGMNV